MQYKKYTIVIERKGNIFYANVYNKKISPYCLKQGIQHSKELAVCEAKMFINKQVKG